MGLGPPGLALCRRCAGMVPGDAPRFRGFPPPRPSTREARELKAGGAGCFVFAPCAGQGMARASAPPDCSASATAPRSAQRRQPDLPCAR